eukprot:CAMPEP_0174981374 /NCGR_PEP_ID=MMETSP0004_2-20121128/15855_1 /TAXON_ID=420556 /ORGANISM="Ochromonas sp., Strain CCMP1393" /LENGTH=536 /DNA_ID=CAMNT_0016233113 /DNA_START=124 /DNA_END=1734 /DNA_ORIENTATION=-
MSKLNPAAVHREMQNYIDLHHLESLISSIVGELLLKKPTNLVAQTIYFLYRNYTEKVSKVIGHMKVRNTLRMEKHNHTHHVHLDSSVIESEDFPKVADHYIETCDLSGFFNSLVEKVLQAKPKDPHGYMVEYLCEAYPKQGLQAVFRIQRNLAVNDDASLDSSSTTKPKNGNESDLMDARAESSDEEEEEDDASEEDGEDDVADIPLVQYSREKPAPRRVSVSAESMDPAKLKEQMTRVANIPKALEVSQALFKVVGKSAILRRMLDAEQRKMIVKAFSGPIMKEAGEDIIKQGDYGDAFYLLEEGVVDVFVAKKNAPASQEAEQVKQEEGEEKEVKVMSYKAGDAFGQLALMYNAPRAATCRVVGGTAKLWALDRVSFKVIVVAAAMQKRELYKDFLSQVPILQSLTEMEVLTLADSLAEEVYEDGAIICREGEEGNDFYIIKDGQAECFQQQQQQQEEEKEEQKSVLVATLSAGHYFGEIALLTSKPRQATVKAKGGTLKVLAIDRATFTRVFGSMDSILQRNMEQYTKYTAAK